MHQEEDVIKRVMEYPIDFVLSKYEEEEKLSPAAAKEHELELKRLLALCCLHPGAKYGMKGPIDRLWHMFILFTKEYSEFCSEVAATFIHHVPEPPHRNGNGESARDYLRFLNDYEKVFGESPPVHLWPRIRNGEVAGVSCSQCNGCAPAPGCAPSHAAAGDIQCSGCGGCSAPE